MEDATGQVICRKDHVMFKSAGAHGDCCGVVVKGMPGPRVVVQCIDGAEVTKNARDITVVDRTFLKPGDTVTSATDRGGQVGVVTGVATALDLVRLDNGGETTTTVARDVSPAAVRRVRELCLGDYVVSGPWLGRVFEVQLDVDVLFDGGGAVCRVARADGKLTAVHRDSLNLHTNSVFYPGQRVRDYHRTVFKASRWLKGYWKPSYVKGTVSNVETSGVLVYWVASAHLGTEKHLVQASAPSAHQSPHNLTFFCDGNAYCLWSVGDRCFFRTPSSARSSCGSEHESLLSTAMAGDHESSLAPVGGLTRTHRNRLRMSRRRRVESKHTDEMERWSMSVAATRTTVDVLWQDGTRQCGVPAVSVLPSLPLNAHEFFPGQRVVWGTPSLVPAPTVVDAHDNATRPFARVGVVRSLDYKDQTMRVSWFKEAREPAEIDCDEETVSAYDLGWDFHHNNTVFYGNIVVRLRSMELARARDGSGSTQDQPLPAHRKEKAAAAATANDLSWVGHIVDLCCDGQVEVKWGDGNTSKVLLHEIVVVKQQDVGEMLREIGDWMYDDGVMNNAVHRAQEDPAQQPAASNENNNHGEDGDDSGSESDGEDGHAAARTTGRLGTVIQAMIQLAGNVLAQGRRYIVNDFAVAEESSSGLAAIENIDVASSSEVDANETSASAASSNAGGADAGEGKTKADATGSNQSFRFPLFDIVESPPDHHYLDTKEQGSCGGRKWTKRVQKEWKILENDLPDTIYVRVFEDRMDLLRVAMIGATGTPYHDDLFFFDLQLPSSYPASPPQVNYRSFGLRLNPNLYESGTVCLSLLNTFGGEGAELWSPEASTILQVVVSIQGLVLTAQPYYNEAGYASQVGTPVGRRNELPYSENAYLLTLQTMLQLLRRPPAGFEEFVKDHFIHRGRHILQASEAYMDGCAVGTLDDKACATDVSREQRPCSMGFRLALANVVPRLIEAFTGIGAEG